MHPLRGLGLFLLLGTTTLALASEAPYRPGHGYYRDLRIEFAFVDQAPVSLTGDDFHSSLKWDYADVESLLKQYGAHDWQRLFFEHSPEKLDQLRKQGQERRGIKLPDLNNWYTAIIDDELLAAQLVEELARIPQIRSAAVTPVPIYFTPNYEANQYYHQAAPRGVGIASGWAESGGNGSGINVIHHEGGWITDHEDLTNLNYTGGGNEYPSGDSGWYNHGTACVSILAAPQNGFGVTGLVHSASGLYSRGFWDSGSPNTWIACTNYINVGDVISASWGYGGSLPSGYSCSCNPGQAGGQPAESNQSDFDAIQTVTANGYIIVNSAANGCVPMDNALYGGIYDLNQRDSGALIIGAIYDGGSPACFTNYGSRIDAHSWGGSVYSAGYGDLNSSSPPASYTSGFGGTSAACPIVSGAVASLQGVYKNSTGTTLDAWELRNLLRTTGTDQTSSPSIEISNQPDLIELIANVGGGGPDLTAPSISHTALGDTGDTSGPYGVSATITDPSGVTSASLFYRVNGGSYTSLGMSVAGSTWTASIPGQSEGSLIEYYITATDGASPSNTGSSSTWSFSVFGAFDGVVILSPSAGANSSGTEWASALTAAGYNGNIANVDNLDSVFLGGPTDALIVLLGVYSNNFVIADGSALALAIEDFINAGGNVYMEGGDCWAYDPGNGGHDFNALFGVTGSSDGTGDLASFTGHGITSGSATYSGENAWIDHLDAAGASLLFSNDAIGYNCGYYQAGARTTACASFELAASSNFQSIVSDLFGSNLFGLLGPGLTPPELVYSPASINASVELAGATSQLVSLQNVGEEVLSWSLTLTQTSANRSVAYETLPHRELAKGEEDPRPGILPQNAGGPDAFGYTWHDSNEAGGPTVNFQDISGTGTAITLSDDQNSGPYSLGFAFDFYGASYNEVRVCSNGFLSFSSTSTTYTNASIPDSAEPNALIAPFWDDLNPQSIGAVYYQSFADRFIIQWSGVPRYGTTEPNTFEAILHTNGTIEFQYGSMTAATLNSATVGIEDAAGTDALQVVFNATYIQSNMALRITPPTAGATWLDASNYSGSIAGFGGTSSFSVLMDATELAAGVYTGNVVISTNEPGSHTIPVTLTVSAGDTTPPVISMSCLGDTYSEASRTISATITDDTAVDLAYASVSVNGGGSILYPLNTSGGSSWTGLIPGAAAGSSVSYHIEAQDPAGNQSQSGSCFYSVLGLDVPDLSITWINASTVQLSWTAVSGAVNYTVYTALDAGGSYTPLLTTAATNSQVPVSSDQVQVFRVTANSN